MRKRLLRMLAAAAIGTGLSASANAAPPVMVPAAPPAAMPAAVPPAGAPPVMVPATPAYQYAPAAPVYPHAPAPAGGCGTTGCDSGCAPEKANLASRFFGKHAIGVGTAMPIGCSCHAANRTFFWGGCNQFFSPGRACDGGPMGYNGCGGGKCPPPPYFAPYGKPGDNCVGPFSYLNR